MTRTQDGYVYCIPCAEYVGADGPAVPWRASCARCGCTTPATARTHTRGNVPWWQRRALQHWT